MFNPYPSQPAVQSRQPSAASLVNKYDWAAPGIIDKLTRLYLEGKSMIEIAAALGTTKNTVLGKIHRLRQSGAIGGKPLHFSPERSSDWWTPERIETMLECQKSGQTFQQALVTMKCSQQRLKAKSIALGMQWPVTVRARSAAPVARPAAPVIHPPKPDSIPTLPAPDPLNIHLANASAPIKGGQCRWPLEDMHICGVQSEPGKPYCAYHCQVSYRRTPTE